MGLNQNNSHDFSSSGKMLHIDFGFILGRDPKPYPPPIKIRMDMIEAMGGI